MIGDKISKLINEPSNLRLAKGTFLKVVARF